MIIWSKHPAALGGLASACSVVALRSAQRHSQFRVRRPVRGSQSHTLVSSDCLSLVRSVFRASFLDPRGSHLRTSRTYPGSRVRYVYSSIISRALVGHRRIYHLGAFGCDSPVRVMNTATPPVCAPPRVARCLRTATIATLGWICEVVIKGL